MKTILYVLIAIVLFGMFAPKINRTLKNEQKIVVQSIDNHLPEGILQQSADIMKERISQYTNSDFTLEVVPEKHQIKVVLNDVEQLPAIKNLMISAGNLGFYETYSTDELEEKFPDSHQLFYLLEPTNNPFELGRCPLQSVGEVNEYIAKWLANVPSQFTWGQLSNNAYFTLYALKLSPDQIEPLDNASVKSFFAEVHPETNSASLQLNFRTEFQSQWQQMTQLNLNRTIALVVDNRVVFAPLIKTEITSGTCEVTGDFSVEEAKFIAALGNNEVLPTKFKIIK